MRNVKVKKLIGVVLVVSIVFNNSYITKANDTNRIIKGIVREKEVSVQIKELYSLISKETGLDEKYIEQIHSLSNGKIIYADKMPNIYEDETVSSISEPISIYKANTKYKEAKFIECDNSGIGRPSKYYLPDAIYSVSKDIKDIMDRRMEYDRGGVQVYFNALKAEVKQEIVFYEAILIYTGEDEETVNNFFKAYEKLLYDKGRNENILEESESGKIVIKDKYRDTLRSIGITDKERVGYIAKVMTYDSALAINDNIESVKAEYVLPYIPNYTSRENMMIAAASLCGKVRYVWGGGHSGASYIDGISPVWKLFNDLYPTTPINEETGEVNIGYRKCIKPSGSWCPIHGETHSSFHGETIHSLDDYIELRAGDLDSTEILSDKYRDMMSKVRYSAGINGHTLDGLDCSGFASWLYNQITDRYEINSTAKDFTAQRGIQEIPIGEELLPGDIFAWTQHIVIIVGKVANNSKAYVTIEQTPNLLKYGVVYYSGASQAEISLAKQIADEANKLIGGIEESPHVYCMNTVGHYTETIGQIEEQGEQLGEQIEQIEEQGEQREEGEQVNEANEVNENGENEVTEENVGVTVRKQYISIGRFSDSFIDEGIKLETGLPIEEMLAKDIIQHVISKLPISYISGYNEYEGTMFNKEDTSMNLGVNIIDTEAISALKEDVIEGSVANESDTENDKTRAARNKEEAESKSLNTEKDKQGAKEEKKVAIISLTEGVKINKKVDKRAEREEGWAIK